jgi:hypothetical protein
LIYRISPGFTSSKINLFTVHDEKYVEKWRRMDMDGGLTVAGAAFKQLFNDL